jgi:hypothetical protein
MSALPPKADKQQTSRYVRFVELADAAIGAAAQHDPRRRAGVDRILDDDSAVDDDGCACAAWVAMRVGVSRLVSKIVRIKDCDVGSVVLLQ